MALNGTGVASDLATSRVTGYRTTGIAIGSRQPGVTAVPVGCLSLSFFVVFRVVELNIVR